MWGRASSLPLARQWHRAIPDRWILPVEQDAITEQKLSGAYRVSAL